MLPQAKPTKNWERSSLSENLELKNWVSFRYTRVTTPRAPLVVTFVTTVSRSTLHLLLAAECPDDQIFLPVKYFGTICVKLFSKFAHSKTTKKHIIALTSKID